MVRYKDKDEENSRETKTDQRVWQGEKKQTGERARVTLFLVKSRSMVASAMMFMRSSKAWICLGFPGCAISVAFMAW